MDTVAVVLCQNCLTAYEVPRSKSGQRARCPWCESVFLLESAPEGVTATEALDPSLIISGPGARKDGPPRATDATASGNPQPARVEGAVQAPVVAQARPRAMAPSLMLVFAFLTILCLGLGGTVIYMARSKTDSELPLPGAPLARTVTVEQVAQRGRSSSDITVDGEVFIATQGGQNVKLGLVEIGLIPMDLLVQHSKQKQDEREQALAQLDPKIKEAEKESEALKKEWERLRDKRKEASEASMSVLHAKPMNWRAYGEASRVEDEAGKAEREAAKPWNDAARKAGRLRSERAVFFSASFFLDGIPPAIRVTKTNSDGRFHVIVPGNGSFALSATASRHVGDKVEKYYWAVKVDTAAGVNQTINLANDNMTSSAAPQSVIHTLE